MNENDLFPVCRILYKTDNTSGWRYAIMSGDEEECKKECEKLKKKDGWHDYICHLSARYVQKLNIPFQNHIPAARDIYLVTDLIYIPNENKWYYPEDKIPLPNKNVYTDNNFKLDIYGQFDEYAKGYFLPLEDVEDFEDGAEILICLEAKNYEIMAIAKYLAKDILIFVERLQREGYANLSVEEYTQAKFLAWEVDNKIRFIIQDYSDIEVKNIYDREISKELFYMQFTGLSQKLEYYIQQHQIAYENFKKEKGLKA